MKIRSALAAWLAGVAVAAIPLSAAEDEAIVLQPNGPWQLEAANDKCRIARLFGANENPTLFYLEQWDPSSVANWAVASQELENYRWNKPTQYKFDRGGAQAEFQFTPAELGRFGPVIGSYTSVSSSDTHPARGHRSLPILHVPGTDMIDRLTVSQQGSRALTLELGAMDRPLKAMNICMRDLVKSWGFDPLVQDEVATSPKILNMMEIARKIQKRYPGSARNMGRMANFHVRLVIDAFGEIEACKLVNQTVAKGFDLDDRPCDIFIEHAEIEPAEKADGSPIRSFFTTRIHYRM